jgi:hypothetical protein
MFANYTATGDIKIPLPNANAESFGVVEFWLSTQMLCDSMGRMDRAIGVEMLENVRKAAVAFGLDGLAQDVAKATTGETNVAQ